MRHFLLSFFILFSAGTVSSGGFPGLGLVVHCTSLQQQKYSVLPGTCQCQWVTGRNMTDTQDYDETITPGFDEDEESKSDQVPDPSQKNRKAVENHYVTLVWDEGQRRFSIAYIENLSGISPAIPSDKENLSSIYAELEVFDITPSPTIMTASSLSSGSCASPRQRTTTSGEGCSSPGSVASGECSGTVSASPEVSGVPTATVNPTPVEKKELLLILCRENILDLTKEGGRLLSEKNPQLFPDAKTAFIAFRKLAIVCAPKSHTIASAEYQALASLLQEYKDSVRLIVYIWSFYHLTPKISIVSIPQDIPRFLSFKLDFYDHYYIDPLSVQHYQEYRAGIELVSALKNIVCRDDRSAEEKISSLSRLLLPPAPPETVQDLVKKVRTLSADDHLCVEQPSDTIHKEEN